MSEPPDDNRPRSQRGDGATYASRSTPPKAQGGPPSGTQGRPPSGTQGRPPSGMQGRQPPRPQERPYKLYRSAPRSLTARLRGETDTELEARAEQLSRQKPPRPPRGGGPGNGGPPRGRLRIPGFRGPRRPRLH